MFPSKDDDVALERLREWHRHERLLPPIQCQRPTRHEGNTIATGDEIDDEVKTVEFHRWRHGESMTLHPAAEGLAGICSGVDHEPGLLLEPEFEPVSPFGRGECRRSDEFKAVFEAVRDLH